MKKRIAIVGGGVSGLTCAYLLQHDYDVHLFEQANRLGGHANTVDVDLDGEQYAVDTGFIVFNDRNYPHFEKTAEKDQSLRNQNRNEFQRVRPALRFGIQWSQSQHAVRSTSSTAEPPLHPFYPNDFKIQ